MTITFPPETDVEIVEQHDHRLGRHKVHDPRSRSYPAQIVVDRSTWHDKAVRVYDPIPNPNQPIGCCTGVDWCVRANTIGNRVMGVVLDMDDAISLYSRATEIDPFTGTYPPTDTGSYGLAVAAAAKERGMGGEYRWNFTGADGAVQLLMDGWAVGVGTWWYEAMFWPDSNGVIKPEGDQAGGHQYTVRGYDLDRDLVLIRCWWGTGYKDVWIARTHLDSLLRDGGDSIIQYRGSVGRTT